MPLPYSTAADFQQTRDFGQKISAVFDFLRAHFRPLARCLVPYALLPPLAGFIAAGVAQKLFFPGYHASGLAAVLTAGFGPALLLSYVPLLLGYALLILTVYGYLLTRMATPPTEAVTPAQVGAFVRAHLLEVLGSLVGVGGVVIVGFVLLLVPGIWLSVVLSLFFMVKLAENRSFGSTISRCIELVKGHWWATFGLLIIISIIQGIVPGVVQIIGGVLIGLAAAFTGKALDVSMLTYAWVAVSQLLSLAMYTLVLLASAFQYFHLVEQQDAPGLYALLEQLGRAAPTPGSAARYQADEEGEY